VVRPDGSVSNRFARVAECPGDGNFFTWDAVMGINVDVLFLFLDGIIFLAILVGLDSGWIQKNLTELNYKLSMMCSVSLIIFLENRKFCFFGNNYFGNEFGGLIGYQFYIQRKGYQEQGRVPLDEDVDEEQKLAKDVFDGVSPSEGSALIVKDMSKNFGRFQAVKGLSFTVKQGKKLKCF